MIRRIVGSLAAISLLAGCGGAGGSGGITPILTPKTPTQSTAVAATFKLAFPGKATMTKLHRNYQSQGTQGIAIDWISTNPVHPDYAAPVSAVCPATLPAGVTACGIDPVTGATDYTFSLMLPIGSYPHFTASAFDAAPSGTLPSAAAFTGAHLLAQGQLIAPVVISPGTTTIPNLTFFGVPAAVSFVPGDAQSHVANFSANNTSGYAIVGNQPQTFFAQATDAAGYFIGNNDGGAPTITVAESTSDPAQYFNVATTANADQFTLQAMQAPVSASITPVINVTATAGGTGLPSVTNSFAITPVQELFTTQSSGEGQAGVVGYPLYPPTYTPSAILDLADPGSGCDGSCDWQYGAIAPNGTFFAIALFPDVAYEFTQGSGSQGLISPGGPSALPVGTDPQSLAIDAQGLLYLEDANSNTVTIFNTSAPTTPLTSISTPLSPNSIAIAPSTSAIPSSLRGSIWVGCPGGVAVYAPYTGGPTPPVLIGPPNGAPATGQGITIDPTGHVWISDGSLLHVFTIASSSSTAGITLTPVATTTLGNNDGAAQIGVTAQGTGWMGGASSVNGPLDGMDPYTLSGSTLTLGATFFGNGFTGIPTVFSAIVVP
jgi:hypothetical protein